MLEAQQHKLYGGIRILVQELYIVFLIIFNGYFISHCVHYMTRKSYKNSRTIKRELVNSYSSCSITIYLQLVAMRLTDEKNRLSCPNA